MRTLGDQVHTGTYTVPVVPDEPPPEEVEPPPEETDAARATGGRAPKDADGDPTTPSKTGTPSNKPNQMTDEEAAKSDKSTSKSSGGASTSSS